MINMPPVKLEYIHMGGGLNQITPTLDQKSGACKAAVNFECSTTGGYSRIAGYERMDGREKPSDALYIVLTVAGSTLPAIGSVVTGAVTGAYGTLAASTSTTFVLTKVTGTFNGTEGLTVSAISVGTQTGFGSAASPKLHAQYRAAAANIYRTAIGKPAGSGAILGGFTYKDVSYCFRNNAGGTAAVMFKSTTSGWTAITFGSEVSFTAASGAPAEGSTVTQGGVTAVVRRVVLQTGAYQGGTATGRLIIDTIAGGHFAAGAFTAGFTATCSGAEAAITLAPGGKINSVETNFAGSALTARVYICDGVNRAAEWDGTTYVPISSGATTDTPKFIDAHKKHLFLFIGSSAIHSAPGLPYDFTALSGASEIAVGDIITGSLVQPGAQTTGAMAIYTRTTTLMLYGTGVSSWNLAAFNIGTGAIPYTAHNMAQSYVLDDRGVVSLATTLNFGNFEPTTLTAAIRPTIIANRNLTTCSVLCREKSQYRLYFSNGMGLHLTIVNGEYLGAMPIYLPIPGGVNNSWGGTLSTGEEMIMLFGADGYVYQAERGTSFDGVPIGASTILHFDSIKSPRTLKSYKKAAVEMQGVSYAEIQFSYTLGYGQSDYAQPSPSYYASNMLSSNWGTAIWGTFFWGTSDLVPVECEMSGTAENVSINFTSNSDCFDSFTINSVLLHYIMRRQLR